MTRLAIFASGRGSNAHKIIEYFKKSNQIEVSLIVSNRSKAGVLMLAEENGIANSVIKKADFAESKQVLSTLKAHKVDVIILAGFLLKIPEYLIKAYPNRILNIHPALLPKYGGKGMYGIHVHNAVYDNKEKESGMTIHLVNEEYDKGRILFQAHCEITKDDIPEDIAAKVLKLEHKHFAPVIETYIAETCEGK